MKSNKQSSNIYILFLAQLIIVSIANPALSQEEKLVPHDLDIESNYFNISNVTISEAYRQTVYQGLQKAEKVLNNEVFLEVIRNKNDWTYSPSATDISGTEIVSAIQSKKHIKTSITVRPKLSFYMPPAWGKDICGGISAGFFKKTKSTGCTINGDIYKNLLKIGDNPDVFMGFLVHEWLHSAGFGHGGNSKQCSKKKRNSVPIYVGCAAQNYLDNMELIKCSQKC